MAESKRTGIKGSMNKDVDDRLLPAGQYRDALNITVGHSEGSDVGAIENVRGNALVAGNAQDNITGTVIGSTTDPQTGYIYYFVTEVDGDTIYEYNPDSDELSIVLIDARAPGTTPDESEETGGDGGGDAGGGGDSGGTGETFTVNVTSFTATVVDVNQAAGQSTYKITLSAAATSTGDAGGTHNISFFKFEETDSVGTVLATQPGSSFGSNQAASNNSLSVETNTISKTSATRYFKVTAIDQNQLTDTDTTNVVVTAGTAALNGSASVPSAVTQGTTLSMSATASGGIAPYTYAWTGPSGYTASGSSVTVTSSASSSHAGQYNVTISDSASPANTITRGGSVSVTTFGTPAVTTLAASGVNVTEMQFNGNVTDGGSPGSVSSRGFYYYPTTSTTVTPKSTVISQGTRITEPSGTGLGTYSLIETGLTGSTKYDFVAWAHNGSNEGTGDVVRETTLPAGTQSIAFSPTSLTDKPHAGASYQVDLTLNNLPDSLINTSITYVTGGSGWISSVTRRAGTDIYDVVFSDMTAQSATSPANRVASIQFTNPTSGTSATLSCHQTMGAAIALTTYNGQPTTINKLGGALGITATVSFDPAGSQAGQWSFYDSLPSWITPAPNSSYMGTTTVTFNLSNNDSGSDRTHTFDARINDGNENDATYQIKDELTISQNQSVNFRSYEFNGLQEKTSLIFYTQSGAFQQAQFSPTQGNNTDDNSLRMTASPFGVNASEVTSIQWKMDYVFGGTYGDSHFLVNGNSVPSSYTNIPTSLLPGSTTQGGQFDLTVTAPGGTSNQPSLSRRLHIRVGNGTSYDVHTITLNRTAT